jgi:hypothetical protein
MKLCRHPHVVRLLEVIDDKLYQKVYMGQFVPIQLSTPPFSLCRVSARLVHFVRSLTLSQLWNSSEAVKSSGVIPRAVQYCG